MPTLTNDDKEWRRESDARTLSEAQEIMSDSKRLKGAKTAAKKMIKEHEKSLKAMEKIAGSSSKRKIKTDSNGMQTFR